jgi:NTE family protein
MQTRPDVLVLGGGGIAGIAWITGVLAGIEDGSGVSLSSCEYFVGTSAGSVVAAHLVSGSRLPRPDPGIDGALAARPDRAPKPNAFPNWALALGGPGASIGMRLTASPGAFARAAALRLVSSERPPIGPVLEGTFPFGSLEAGGELSAAGGRTWDGRLRVVAVEQRTGRRVVFGSPGAPDATLDQAVQASCSVPWLFAPVSIGGVDYVDGGIWSPTSLDAAPARQDTRVLCLCPTASPHGPLPFAIRAASRAATLVEAAVITGRGGRAQLIAPDRHAAGAIGTRLMGRESAADVLAAGYRQGLTL